MVSVTCTSLVYHSSSQDSNHGRSQHKGQRLRRERHVGGGQEGSEYDGGKHSEGKRQRAGHAHNSGEHQDSDKERCACPRHLAK